jgi:DNA polymerase-1
MDMSEFITDYYLDDDEDDWNFESEKLYTLDEIIARNPNKSYEWLKKRKYHVIKSLDEAIPILKEIYEWDGIVSFDTETTGLTFNFTCGRGLGDRLVGIIFAIRPGEAWYFAIANKKFSNICTPENENYVINKYFKPILERKDILAHNGSFDWRVMYTYGIDTHLVHDTIILPRVTLWNTNRGLELGLKSLTSLMLHRDSFELSDFVSGKWGKNNSIKFWDLDEESVKYYACPDADNALELFNYFMEEGVLEKFGAKKTYELEVQVSVVIAYQEYYGHCIDVNKVDELQKNIKKDKEKEYKAMVDLIGHEFNPRSNKELPHILYTELGYPVKNVTATGNPSTDSNTRKWLMEQKNPDGSDKYPFARHLDTYLNNAQLESNFVNNLEKFATDDGFMFSSVKQFLETGRLACSEPNYQSYSDVVKHYVVPRNGYYMLDSDYSSIEYRILACMAGQQNLIDRFVDPDMDYHTYQASRMFGVPYELVTKSLRRSAKGINFGIPYGMGDPKLGESLFGERTPENTIKAKKMKRLYFTGQENIEKFFIKARQDGVTNLYSETNFGRRRYFDPRKADKGRIEREAGNNRIQGTAADIYKIAIVRLFHNIRKLGVLGKILISAFVHDEVLIEVHKSIDPAKMLTMLRESMMLKIPGWCPLYTGCGFGTNWYDAKKTEIPVQVQEYICKTWGETGLDWWDGDTERLFYWEVGLINDYKRDRVIDYMKKEENWGKVLSPVENGFAHEVLDEINAGRHVDGVVNKEVSSKKDMIENLEQFSIAFGVEDLFKQANIQAPKYDDAQSTLPDASSEDDSEEEDTRTQEEIIQQYLNIRGIIFHDYLNSATKKIENSVFFRYEPQNKPFMDLIYRVFVRNPGQLPVYTIVDGKVKRANVSVNTSAFREANSLYMTRRTREISNKGR